MRTLARLRSLWRGVFHRDRMEDDLDQELRASFEELLSRHLRAGLAPEAARRAALREMDGMHRVGHAVRATWLVSAWEAPLQDLRQAWRGLRSTPAVSAVAVATFALGMGAVTAVLAVVEATLFTPPPYRDPSRLVLVWADLAGSGHRRAPLSGPELHDLRDGGESFEGFAAIWANSIVLTDSDEPEFVRIGLVTGNYFPLLGVEPALGRTLHESDEGGERAAEAILLSWGLWQRRFGGDPGVVGRSIGFDDRRAVVVGVLPDGFRVRLPPNAGIPEDVEAYMAFPWPVAEGPRGQKYLRVVGRMKPGVPLARARQEVDAVAARAAREHAEYGPRPPVFETVGLEADSTRDLRKPLWIVAAGVALLLLVSAANVLGVLIARAAARRRETALRIALGAGVGRLLRLSLAEGLTLAVAGAGLGVVAGHGLLRALLALQPEALRRFAEVSMDGRVMAAAAGLALVWGGLFALAPLSTWLRSDVNVLLAPARTAAPALRRSARSAFVVAQVAITLVLLVCAGLLTRTLVRVQGIDPGFAVEGVLSFRVPSTSPRYGSPEARDALARRMRSELLSLPGVAGVGSVSHLPYDSIPNWGGPYSTVERPDEALPTADYRSISPGYLEAAGITLLSGRAFSESDHAAAEPVAIVDDMLARRVWRGEPALGKRLRVDPGSTGAPTTWVTVVGVVRHVRHRSLIETLSEQVYFPLSQAFRNPVAYVVRGGGDPAALGAAVREAVRRVDPRLPIYELRPLSAYLSRARSVQRFTALLVGVFAGVAVILASVGVYGVISYVVLQRRREYGVRMALGATRSRIVALVVGEGVRLAGLGAAAGIGASLAAGELIRSQLFGVAPSDGLTYAVALPVLGLSALAACWWPARRAVAADVLEVLRAE